MDLAGIVAGSILAQNGVFDAQQINWAGIQRLSFESDYPELARSPYSDNYFQAYMDTLSNNPSLVNGGNQYLYQALLYERGGRRSSGAGSGSSGPSKAQTAASIEAEIRNIAGVLGINNRDWNSLAWEATNNNWNAAMIRDRLADMLDISMVNTAGIVQQTKARTTELARKYFVNVTDQEALDWAKRLASEEIDDNQITVSIRDRAKAQYYWLADVIDSGVTLDEHFQSHKALVSQLLEVAPDSVNFMGDEKFNKILSYKDPESNSQRSMNLFETAKYIRGLDEWKQTSNAAGTAADAAVAVARAMGAMG